MATLQAFVLSQLSGGAGGELQDYEFNFWPKKRPPVLDSTVRPRQSFHMEFVPLLRDMILACELQPGEKLSEPKLCKHFGVSRTPLREALKVLAAEGLVVLQPNRGARIATITPAEVDQLFPIMGALEALAGECACNCMTNGEHARVDAAPYRSADLAAASKLGRMVHESIGVNSQPGNDPLLPFTNSSNSFSALQGAF